MTHEKLTPAGFAEIVGCNVTELPLECLTLLNTADFSFEELPEFARDECILAVLKRILADDLPASGNERQGQWEAGWTENLKALEGDPQSLAALTPKYYRRSLGLRFCGRFVRPRSQTFEYDFFRLIRAFVTEKFLNDVAVERVYEFGCGPCQNLAYFAERFPARSIIGCDWARASQQIAALLEKHHYRNVHGTYVDFFNPKDTLTLLPGSAVITFGAFEQLGDKFRTVLNFLIDQAPLIVVNVEPVDEFYDPDTLMDYLALTYHRKRRYLHGYKAALVDVHELGRIRELYARRIPVGGLYHEGWNILAWKI